MCLVETRDLGCLFSSKPPICLLAAKVHGLAGHEKADDEPEQTENGAENLDNEDLDEAAERHLLVGVP